MEDKKNIMREIKMDKLTLSCGTGTDALKLERGIKMLEIISGHKAVKTFTKRRLPAFDIRPGMAIGCKVTIRGKKAAELLKTLLAAISNKLLKKQFNPGSFSFGIKEYIEIPGMVYNVEIGIMGFDVCVTLKRSGERIKIRKIKRGNIPKRHHITIEETRDFMVENFNVEIEEKKK